MANMLDVGYVALPGQDVLPTTGPHLDVRVTKEGKYIDPGKIRSLLTKLKIGKERTPLWQQTGEQWKPSFQITSGYGQRVAPAPGASTFHPAQDYGIPGGTPIAWEGPGTFTPGKGYGTIKTTDPQGTPYEIRLLHTKGGKPGELTSELPQQPQPQPQRAGDTYIFVTGRKKEDVSSPDDFLSSYIQSALSGKTAQVKSMIDPVSMLTSAFSQTPNYLT